MGVPQHLRRPRAKTQSQPINGQFPVIPRVSVNTVFIGQLHDHGFSDIPII